MLIGTGLQLVPSRVLSNRSVWGGAYMNREMANRADHLMSIFILNLNADDGVKSKNYSIGNHCKIELKY